MTKNRSTKAYRGSRANLGQHFLRSRSALKTMEEASGLRADNVILEIGPGKGELTRHLLASRARIIAVEKDPTLVAFLKKRFAKNIATRQLTLVCDDIRDFSPERYALQATSYKIVANIPYYITGEIIRTFLTAEHQPERMVLLVQREVAERIVARDGKESVLSIAVKTYGTPRYVRTVKRGSFTPPPKIDSAILSIEDISRAFFSSHGSTKAQKPKITRSVASSISSIDADEERFFELVRRGFAHKRKLLRSNLNVSKDTLDKCAIAPNARAENVSLEQWKCLSKRH